MAPPSGRESCQVVSSGGGARVIVSFDQLEGLRHDVAMVDGCFDPLHRGHIEYFDRALQLGVPVLCNIAQDEYLRTKHPPLLPRGDRAAIIDALRAISYTHISDVTTADVLRQLRPKYYVKGEDWRPSLPAEQAAIARQFDIEIVYLPTVRDSSSRILQNFLAQATALDATR
jgi:cytidyltransferase-like protein